MCALPFDTERNRVCHMLLEDGIMFYSYAILPVHLQCVMYDLFHLRNDFLLLSEYCVIMYSTHVKHEFYNELLGTWLLAWQTQVIPVPYADDSCIHKGYINGIAMVCIY